MSIKGQLIEGLRRTYYDNKEKTMLSGKIADETGSLLVVIFNDEATDLNEKDYKIGSTIILHSVKVRISPLASKNKAWQIQPDNEAIEPFKITIGTSSFYAN